MCDKDWTFPASQLKFTSEDRGKGDEPRIIITLQNGKQANIPAAGVKINRINGSQRGPVESIFVNNSNVRKTIRSAQFSR